LAEDNKDESNKIYSYDEHGVPIFDGRLSEIENEQARAKQRDELYKNQQLKLNKRMAGFTLALVIVGAATGGVSIWQATIANKSANAAKSAAQTAEQSFKMARRRAEDSDEAICNVRGDLESGSNIEHISVFNSGKVPAHGVVAHIEISRNRLPRNERLTLFQSLDISQDELRSDPILRDVVLSEFGNQDWVRIGQLREAVVVSGAIGYENGFESKRQHAFCQAFLMQPNPPGNNPSSSGVLVDCDRLPGYLAALYMRLRSKPPGN